MELKDMLKNNSYKNNNLSKEEYAKQQKELKESLWGIANAKFQETVSSPENYLHYLDIQSRSTLSPTNVMLGMKQFPNLGETHELDTWQTMGKTYVKKGEKAFYIFKPVQHDEFTFYNPVKAFEISQLQFHPRPPKHRILTDQEKLDVLQFNAPLVEFVDTSEIDVLYNPDSRRIEISETSNDDMLLQKLVREQCYAVYDKTYNYDRESARMICESAAYMMCIKMGLEPNAEFANDVIGYFGECDPKEIRTELEIANTIYKEEKDRVDRNIHVRLEKKEPDQER